MSVPTSFLGLGARLARVLGLALGCGLVPGSEALAQPGRAATGRFEETSPSVTWTGSWSKNSLPANSGGGARLVMDGGAEATFTFEGASVSWIGYRDEWCGLADVLVDGALRATVDTYATPAKAQVNLFSVDGLGPGNHTLTIRVRGTHGPASKGSWVWVDAFSVSEPDSLPSPSSSADSRRSEPPDSFSNRPPRSSSNSPAFDPRSEYARIFEQEDPAASWIGSWSTNRLAAHSGHSARLSMERTARVDFAFRGTSVRWLGYRDEWSGIADVLIDGSLRATVDTYSAPAVAQVEIYAIQGLRDGPHTLTIQPTGRRRPASGGAWIWVDSFSVR